MRLEAALRDLDDADPRVRAQAADALGRADDGDRDAAGEALARAVDDKHAAVRYSALLSLGELGASERMACVVERLDDGEPLVREAATIALGQLGAAALAENAADRVEAAWVALDGALAAPASEVRFQAVASLAEIDAVRAAPRVRSSLADPDPKVRAQAAAALGDARDRDSADLLVKALGDRPTGGPLGELRHEAALALARIGDRRCVPALLEALSQADQALDAATALAELGVRDDALAKEALAREVTRFFGDPLVKVHAAEALARAGDPRGRAHLTKAARARRDDVRGLAESVLLNLGKLGS